MKILQINSVYGIRSTGRIASDFAEVHEKHGIESYAVSGEGKFDSPKIHVMSGKLYQKFNILMTRLFGRHGFYNKLATKRMLKFIDKVSPDIIHLHNIHGHYINIEMLFNYIAEKKIPVVWVLHDCWALTGHCPHFDYIGCDKWKEGCGNCPQRRGYPDSWFFDRSKRNYADKKRLFTSVEKMHILTSSKWIADLARQSYLAKYPVSVIYNGINIDVFKPTPTDLKEKLGISDKFVILGIVSNLNSTKGGQYFLELSKMLKEDEHIVLLSLEEGLDTLPHNITAIKRTDSTEELAQIYSAADVFVNPTLQDTFPTVNLEALACGVPVVTFDTGGCAESIDEHSGIVVKKGDAEGLYQGICRVRSGEISREACRKRGLVFDRKRCFDEYIEIYKDIVK